MNTHLMRVVALSTAILAPVMFLLGMVEIAAALLACSAVAGVMAIRGGRRRPPTDAAAQD